MIGNFELVVHAKFRKLLGTMLAAQENQSGDFNLPTRMCCLLDSQRLPTPHWCPRSFRRDILACPPQSRVDKAIIGEPVIIFTLGMTSSTHTSIEMHTSSQNLLDVRPCPACIVATARHNGVEATVMFLSRSERAGVALCLEWKRSRRDRCINPNRCQPVPIMSVESACMLKSLKCAVASSVPPSWARSKACGQFIAGLILTGIELEAREFFSQLREVQSSEAGGWRLSAARRLPSACSPPPLSRNLNHCTLHLAKSM
jgi:hypothetical protein